MPEKRRIRNSGGQINGQRSTTTQTTLRDLFQRTNSGATSTRKEKDVHPQCTDPPAQTIGAHTPTHPARPSRLSQPVKVPAVQERPRDTFIVNDAEVIGITDVSSDIELSAETPLSRLSPRSESSQATSHSPPIHAKVHCHSDTSFSRAGDKHTPLHKISERKEPTKQTLRSEDVAPLPSSWSQHVRGVQHSFTFDQAPLKRSALPTPSPSKEEGTQDFFAKWRQRVDDSPPSPLDRIQRSLTPQQCKEYLQSLSRGFTEAHPAFAQILIHPEEISSSHADMWTRRFRPRRANEVLGNERHALYLRDWLRALELQLRGRQPEEPVSETREKGASKKVEQRGVKRPRVVRAVTKKRGSKKRRVDSDDDLDDFVVFSDADEEEADGFFEDSEDELAFCQRTLTRLHRRDARDTRDAHLVAANERGAEIKYAASALRGPVETNFTDGLTNTLLITGPSGCGKTAAVYACAEELGWEVFEVYPGIGRRNGASLDHLVGDVGRNHIVHGGALTKRTREGLGSYLAKREKEGEFGGGEEGTRGRPIRVEREDELQPWPSEEEKEITGGAGISGKCYAESEGSRPIVRQSVVLLEEVDVLFKEDAGFWAGVVEFIRGCQRPVVMTCNDPGLVPVGDLPLQRVLVFEPCPSTVAATFLQCVSLTEGCLVPHEDLMALYESTRCIRGLDVVDGTIYPRTEPVGTPDLRRSITQLQMLCAGARHGSMREEPQGVEARGGGGRRSGGPISAASRVREWWRKMNRDSEVMSHVDAELCGKGRVEVVVTGGHGYVELGEGEGEEGEEEEEEGLIAEEVIRCSRGVHVGSGTGPSEASITGLDANARVVEALQGVVGMTALGSVVFLDYIPWVRHMVAVDDELERRALCGAGSGRTTRNSLRTVHARSVAVDAVALSLLRDTRLM